MIITVNYPGKFHRFLFCQGFKKSHLASYPLVQKGNLDADMNRQIILVGSLAYYASEIAPTLATRWSSRSITLENSIDFALKESSHWRTPNDDSSLELLLDENDDDLEDDDDDNDYNGRRLPTWTMGSNSLLNSIESLTNTTGIVNLNDCSSLKLV